MSSNWKSIFKHWAGVPLLILLVLVILWAYVDAGATWNKWQAEREMNRLNNLYQNDTYGGQTPEETYDLFIVALKNGDTKLASKYFVVEKQDDWKETLDKYKERGVLGEFLVELEENKKVWRKSNNSNDEMISFVYDAPIEEDKIVEFEGQEITIPAGDYVNESMFIKYPTGIWKIMTI